MVVDSLMLRDRKLKKYLLNAIATGMGNALVSAIFVVICVPIVIKIVGFEQYGAWALLAIFTSLSNVTDIGVSKSVVYFGGNSKSQVEFNEFYSAAFYINIFIIIFFGILFFIGFPILFEDIKGLDHEQRNALFFSGGIIFILSQISGLYRALLEARLLISVVNVGLMLNTATLYSALLIVTLLDLGLNWMFFSSVLVNLLCLMYYIFIFRNRVAAKLYWFDFCKIKQIISYSSGFLSLSLINSLLLPLNRYLLLQYTGSTAAHGIFDIGLKISLLVNSFLTAVSTPLYSLFSQAGLSDAEKIKAMVSRFTYIILIAYCVSVFCFYMIGNEVLSFMFVDTAGELFYVTLIMMAGICVTGIAEPSVRALWGSGDLWITVKIRLLLPVLYVVFIYVFQYYPSIYRFSLAYSLPFIMTSLLSIIIFRVNCKNVD